MYSSVTSLLRLLPATIGTFTKTTFQNGIVSRNVHLTSASFKMNALARSLRDLRPEGKKENESFDLSDVLGDSENVFPDEHTPDSMHDGIPYKYLPIFNIKACKNNTIINVTDYKGKTIIIKSCGTEGYKTAKKGTNVAAQATAYAISKEAVQKGIKVARVRVQGIGPGRLSALKGLQTGGTTVVSITDNTPISWNPPRPRKRRRV